jgi:hypothetical protein
VLQISNVDKIVTYECKMMKEPLGLCWSLVYDVCKISDDGRDLLTAVSAPLCRPVEIMRIRHRLC